MNNIWYTIPGFNGYELDDYGNIRSMKFYNAYPGKILKRRKTYILTNDNNERVKVTYDQLYNIVKNNPDKVLKRNQDSIYTGSRNKIIIGNNKEYKKEEDIILDFSKFIEKEKIKPIYYE